PKFTRRSVGPNHLTTLRRPWLIVAVFSHLVTRHQPDQPVAGQCNPRECFPGRRRNLLFTITRFTDSSGMITLESYRNLLVGTVSKCPPRVHRRTQRSSLS